MSMFDEFESLHSLVSGFTFVFDFCPKLGRIVIQSEPTPIGSTLSVFDLLLALPTRWLEGLGGRKLCHGAC
jgi:hypothetical protein